LTQKYSFIGSFNTISCLCGIEAYFLSHPVYERICILFAVANWVTSYFENVTVFNVVLIFSRIRKDV